MKNTETYKGCTIQTSKGSHCALVFKKGELIKCIAGDVLKDGSNNAFDKAKKYIDEKN